MKKLELTQMENLQGGTKVVYQPPQVYGGDGGGFLTNCAGASVGLAFGFIGFVAGATSVVGAGIGAVGFIYVSAQWGAACR